MSPIEIAKDLEKQISELESVILDKKLGKKSNEFLDLKILTEKYLSITKPIQKYPNTNTHQNHF